MPIERAKKYFVVTYQWRGADTDPYPRGNGYMFDIFTQTWDDRPDTDFCFKTYGYNGLKSYEYENHFLIRFVINHPDIFPLLYRILNQLI